MNFNKKILAGFLLSGWTAVTTAATDLESAFDEGKVEGNIRAYYNMRDYSTQSLKADQTAFALGGGLRAETAPLNGVRLGAGFYTAQDLGTNSNDPTRVEGRLGNQTEVLGEAYLNYTGWDTSVTVGRQKIVTPFANPIDVFLVPFTFEGISIKNNSIADVTLELNYINTIKSGNSHSFVDVGVWTTNRLGVEVTDTSGTLMAGATYKKGPLDVQGWYNNFSDLFDTLYTHAGYTFTGNESVQPFVAAQFGMQQESGDELLGKVDSTLFGVQGGASVHKAKFVAAYTTIAEQDDAFNNGGFLTPYNFSTSPLFTNSMLENIENVDSGDAVKLTAFYYFPSVEVKLSYAAYDYTELADRDAVDFDVIYNMNKYVKGLSLRYRVEVVTSSTASVEQTDQRFQMQYVF